MHAPSGGEATDQVDHRGQGPGLPDDAVESAGSSRSASSIARGDDPVTRRLERLDHGAAEASVPPVMRAVASGASIRERPYLPTRCWCVSCKTGAPWRWFSSSAEAESRRRRDGSEYFKLAVGDRTGAVPAVLGDEAQRELCVVGDALHVTGQFTRDPRYGGQIVVSRLRAAAAGEYDPADLQDGPPRPVEQLEADLRSLIDTVQDPWLRSLLDGLLGEGTATWAAYREAPAAKRYHQAYRHGLLEHSLSVAEGVSAHLGHLPRAGSRRRRHRRAAARHRQARGLRGDRGGDRDDRRGQAPGRDPARLLPRPSRDRGASRLPRPSAREAVLHIILSHHGSLEHGSPVVPCTREATLVHFLDNLGGRLGSFDRLEKELPDGERWSAFDRALGSGAYFGAERRAA